MGQTEWLALIALFVAATALFIVLYFPWRDRRDFDEMESELTSPLLSGLNETGGLTLGAKQALRDYMFRLFAGAGAIVAIVAGVAGYMIKDLATKTAIADALQEIQAPLMKQMAKVVENTQITKDAASKVDHLREQVKSLETLVNKDEFVSLVVSELSENEGLQKRIKVGLAKEVSTELINEHLDDLRGDRGKDGVSPSVKAVASALAREHRDRLRGKKGDPGDPGKDGVSPSVEAVAAALARQAGDQLREQKRDSETPGPNSLDKTEPGNEQ